MDERANQSEVAALRGRIRAQNIAARWAITGLAAGAAQHEFITARFRRMEEYHQRLTRLVGENEATNTLIELFDEGGAAMSEQRAGYDLAPREQADPSDRSTWPPCLYELGDHVLEISEEQQAIIINKAQFDENVILQKDVLYHLLMVLQELFAHDTLVTSKPRREGREGS